MNKVKVLERNDNVATSLEGLKAGMIVNYKFGTEEVKVKILDDILYGHKFAIKDIKKNSPVIKYGEIIGKASNDIKTGEHVHIHNVDGNRASSNK